MKTGSSKIAVTINGKDMNAVEKAADVVVLPKGVEGTNCGNCEYFDDGTCQHPKMEKAKVTNRMCCIYWDNPGAKRPWQE
jgi:hypothetical protein